jgi:hypothetical protein
VGRLVPVEAEVRRQSYERKTPGKILHLKSCRVLNVPTIDSRIIQTSHTLLDRTTLILSSFRYRQTPPASRLGFKINNVMRNYT